MDAIYGVIRSPDRRGTLLLAAITCVVLTACHPDQDATAVADVATQQGAAAITETAASPKTLADVEAQVPTNSLKAAYFGEIHVHTAFSLDAYSAGTRLTPDMAYRFAKGETVTVSGQPHHIVKPLDFAAVTDHAQYLAERYPAQVESVQGNDNLPVLAELEASKSAWQLTIQAASDNYEPGVFSTLVAFEWSAAHNGANLHRNILFRDLDVPAVPFSPEDSSAEEKLWDWLETQEAQGRRLTAIPHNANASKGLLFAPVDNSGKPIDAVYAERRSHFERVIEVMQVKGSSEVHRMFWPADEFADFENADSMQNYSDRAFQRDDFIRAAIIQGLSYDQQLGQNPYKLGFVGGSGSYNGTPSDVVEDNYIGSHGGADGSVASRRDNDMAGWIVARDSNPGSITGVWASNNTRGEIWDALRARETFVTSGPRIQPRFFGGIGLTAENPQALVEQGYAAGVPMGGELSDLNTPPTFTVHALKDPSGANLDRIQIIKGWIDVAGNPQDKIVDVAWSGDRMPNVFEQLPPVGSTVDLSAASYTNAIGSAELMGSWTDYDFDPRLRALYYVRVLEIPTPRWTTYDAVRNNLPLPEGVPATIQERAWTSPIWYTPAR